MMSKYPQRLVGELEPVTARLGALRPLSLGEISLIKGLSVRKRVVPAGRLLLETSQRINRATFVLSGWACRQSTLPDGRRQIVGLILPGEGMGLRRRSRPVAMTDVVALTDLITVDAEPLLVANEGVSASLEDVLELAAALEEQQMINQVVRLGRQTACERCCSFLIELGERLNLACCGQRDQFELPVTQEVLSDALGLSVVHMNRTLQSMRRDGLIELQAGMLCILNRPLMERLSGRV